MIEINAEYELELVDNGKTLFHSKFDNLITNKAFSYGNPFSSGFIVIGSGDREPRPADTSLQNEVGFKSATFMDNSPITLINNKRYVRKQVTGSITGVDATISEVGFRKEAGAETLISRTLVHDANGNRTVIPIQAHQELKITYYVYIRMPDTLGSGQVQTGYQNIGYTIQTSPTMSAPKGVYQGLFNNPSAGKRLTAHLVDGITKIHSNAIVWNYNITLKRAYAIVYFPAVSVTRTITHFTFEEDAGLPTVELTVPMMNPEETDISIPLTFTWGRGA